MAEANVTQLAKVEVDNAIADWSCPGGRVT